MGTSTTDTIKQMMRDWDALSPALQQRYALIARIAALETELRHRERANAHLRGIPKQQNETAIATLYDTLVDANIALKELS